MLPQRARGRRTTTASAAPASSTSQAVDGSGTACTLLMALPFTSW